MLIVLTLNVNNTVMILNYNTQNYINLEPKHREGQSLHGFFMAIRRGQCPEELENRSVTSTENNDSIRRRVI